MKGSVLELGGKDAMIVCADANLANAISGCLWGGFANAGQTCSGIERVYVVKDVADRFIEGVVEGAKALRVGDPMEWETEVGPMVSQEQLETVKELVDDAVANGATLHCGGAEPPFFRPAVLTGVTHDMRIMREEIFGPVVPIMTVEDEDEAIALANDSEFGLGASVWTMNRAKGERIAGRLESGMVWVNDHMFSHGACSCSWGGVKNSGLGRSHSKFGLYECVNIKLVTWEPSRTRDFWWHPYDEALGKAMQASARLLYGRDADKPGALRRGAAAAGPRGRARRCATCSSADDAAGRRGADAVSVRSSTPSCFGDRRAPLRRSARTCASPRSPSACRRRVCDSRPRRLPAAVAVPIALAGSATRPARPRALARRAGLGGAGYQLCRLRRRSHDSTPAVAGGPTGRGTSGPRATLHFAAALARLGSIARPPRPAERRSPRQLAAVEVALMALSGSGHECRRSERCSRSARRATYVGVRRSPVKRQLDAGTEVDRSHGRESSRLGALLLVPRAGGGCLDGSRAPTGLRRRPGWARSPAALALDPVRARPAPAPARARSRR